jgi:DNA-binding NarL/FixJ family response regulator
MIADGRSVPTYIIPSSRLAGRYLVQILSDDAFIEPVLFENAPQHSTLAQCVVFILDISTSSFPVGECLRRLRSSFSRPRFIVVGVPRLDAEIVCLLKLGVHGFVEDSTVDTTLRRAVREVANGGLWISRDVLQEYIHSTGHQNGNHSPHLFHLTQREMQVHELLKRRLSNKEIGGILQIRESTVKYHVSNILGKLQVTHRQELLPDRQHIEGWQKLLA